MTGDRNLFGAPHPACPFCEIAQGKRAAEIVLRTQGAIAFRPQHRANARVIVAPVEHTVSVDGASDEALLAWVTAWGGVAEALGIRRYRVHVEEGRGHGVAHLHAFVLLSGGAEVERGDPESTQRTST